MSTSLPERPDLDQLRRQAKELRDAARGGDPAAAERFARHHPSASAGPGQPGGRPAGHRPRAGLFELAHAEGGGRRRDAAADDHAAPAGGRLDRGTAAPRSPRLLRADPGIAGRSLPPPVVLGDADSVRARLAADAEAALAVDDERGWPPLLYACYSPLASDRPRPGRRAGRSGQAAARRRRQPAHEQRRLPRRVPLGAARSGRGEQPTSRRGAARGRSQPRRWPLHRAGGRPARPPLPRTAPRPEAPG